MDASESRKLSGHDPSGSAGSDVQYTLVQVSRALQNGVGGDLVYSTSADRVSIDPFATQGGSGEDILGRGVSLVNRATATASIISAQSYMDAVGYNQPTDSHRGASVTVQPANGRLETHVTWFYNPGESISYTIRWVVSYPRGMRPVNSIPKSSSCTDEQ